MTSCHWVRLWWRSPVDGRNQGLLAGPQTHRAGLLSLQPSEVRLFSLSSRSTATHHVDHVPTSPRLLEVKGQDGIFHPSLQDFERQRHLNLTHDRASSSHGANEQGI
jgi:hypothetical protein